MKRTELLRVVAIAPLAVVPVVVVSGLGSSNAGLLSDFGWGLFFSVVLALPLAYIGIVCVGLPTYLILHRFPVVSPWWLCVVGAAVPFAALFDAQRMREAIVGAACGTAVAAVAVILLRRGAERVA
jgi:hypothetical protein